MKSDGPRAYSARCPYVTSGVKLCVWCQPGRTWSVRASCLVRACDLRVTHDCRSYRTWFSSTDQCRALHARRTFKPSACTRGVSCVSTFAARPQRGRSEKCACQFPPCGHQKTRVALSWSARFWVYFTRRPPVVARTTGCKRGLN